jgi:hypothetical protein
LCSDLTESLRPILDHNLRLTGQEW